MQALRRISLGISSLKLGKRVILSQTMYCQPLWSPTLPFLASCNMSEECCDKLFVLAVGITCKYLLAIASRARCHEMRQEIKTNPKVLPHRISAGPDLHESIRMLRTEGMQQYSASDWVHETLINGAHAYTVHCCRASRPRDHVSARQHGNLNNAFTALYFVC